MKYLILATLLILVSCSTGIETTKITTNEIEYEMPGFELESGIDIVKKNQDNLSNVIQLDEFGGFYIPERFIENGSNIKYNARYTAPTDTTKGKFNLSLNKEPERIKAKQTKTEIQTVKENFGEKIQRYIVYALLFLIFIFASVYLIKDYLRLK